MIALFRSEVVAEKQEKFLGEVALARPLSFRIYVWASLLIGLSLAAFIIFGEYTRKARVSGYVTSSLGVARVFSPQSGIVVARNIAEGQTVERGVALYVVSLERSSRGAADPNASKIELLKRQSEGIARQVQNEQHLADAEEQELRGRIAGLERETKGIRAEIQVQQERLASMDAQQSRVRSLVNQGYISKIDEQAKQDASMQQRASLAALGRSEAGIASELASLRVQLPEISLRLSTRLSELDRLHSQVEQDLLDAIGSRDLVIRAPISGVVTAVHTEVGQLTSTSQPLLMIIPANSLFQLVLLAPTQAVAFIRPGQDVAIRYRAFPFEQFGHQHGVVKVIDSAATSAAEPGSANSSEEESVYRVIVVPDAQSVTAYGTQVPLKVGMELDADVRLETRKLWEWALEPLFRVSGSL